MSVQKQLSLILGAEGLISAAGAGFGWQFWMKPMSMLLVIHQPFHQAPTCAKNPEVWHETTGLHIGHSSVTWRICGNRAEFVTGDALAVLNFSWNINQEAKAAGVARTCAILHWRFSKSYENK